MNNKMIAVLIMAGVLLGSTIACTTTNGNGLKPLEQMSDLDYSKWKLYIQLGVKIGANRLLQEKVVTHDQLYIAAAAIDGVKGEPVAGGAKSLIVPALHKAGFSNDEVEFVLAVAEQELLAHGALNWINPQTNVLELSPRTKEMLGVIADSLRTAGTVTQEEQTNAAHMKADFCRSAQ